jgi:hypothetical protein
VSLEKRTSNRVAARESEKGARTDREGDALVGVVRCDLPGHRIDARLGANGEVLGETGGEDVGLTAEAVEIGEGDEGGGRVGRLRGRRRGGMVLGRRADGDDGGGDLDRRTTVTTRGGGMGRRGGPPLDGGGCRMSPEQRTGGIEVDGSLAHLEGGPVRSQTSLGRDEPEPLLVPVEPEAEELGTRRLGVVVEPADGERIASDGSDVSRGGRLPRPRDPGTPGTELFTQPCGVPPKEHVAVVDLDRLQVEAGGKVDTHLLEVRLGPVDAPRMDAHIEKPDREPARANAPHLDIEMPARRLGRHLGSDERPERQPHRRDRQHEPGEDEQLPSAHREAETHCSAGRLTRRGWPGHPGSSGCPSQTSNAQKKRARRSGLSGKNPGSVLLSHTASRAVPSAPRSLTSEFGKGSGVASSRSPPETCWIVCPGHHEGARIRDPNPARDISKFALEIWTSRTAD